MTIEVSEEVAYERLVPNEVGCCFLIVMGVLYKFICAFIVYLVREMYVGSFCDQHLDTSCAVVSRGILESRAPTHFIRRCNLDIGSSLEQHLHTEQVALFSGNYQRGFPNLIEFDAKARGSEDRRMVTYKSDFADILFSRKI